MLFVLPVRLRTCTTHHFHLSRKYKYDANVTEYFVQTSDTVKVKRSQLDRWMQAEEKAQEDWNSKGLRY